MKEELYWEERRRMIWPRGQRGLPLLRSMMRRDTWVRDTRRTDLSKSVVLGLSGTIASCVITVVESPE